MAATVQLSCQQNAYLQPGACWYASTVHYYPGLSALALPQDFESCDTELFDQQRGNVTAPVHVYHPDRSSFSRYVRCS